MGQSSPCCNYPSESNQSEHQIAHDPSIKAVVPRKNQIKVLGKQSTLEMLSRNDKLIKLHRVPCDDNINGENANQLGMRNSQTKANQHSHSLTSKQSSKLKPPKLPREPRLYSSPSRSSTSLTESQNLTKFALLPIQERNLLSSESSGIKGSAENLVNVTELYPDGSKYEGQKYEGKRQGKGTFTFANKSVYRGDWHRDKMKGKGILYYSNGSIAYEGGFSDNRFNGFGYLYRSNDATATAKGVTDSQIMHKIAPRYFEDFNLIGNKWTHYEGAFKADQKHGRGRLYFVNGDFIVADFYQGLITGDAVLHRADNTMVKGYWRNNKLIHTFF